MNDGVLGRTLDKDPASGCFTAVPGGERSSTYLLLMGVEFLGDPEKQNFLRLSWENRGFISWWTPNPDFPRSHFPLTHRGGSVAGAFVGFKSKPVSRVSVPSWSSVQSSSRLAGLVFPTAVRQSIAWGGGGHRAAWLWRKHRPMQGNKNKRGQQESELFG